MVKDREPFDADRCFVSNNRHPWDNDLAALVSQIEETFNGRLGCKEEEELMVSRLAHHRISLSEAEVQDAYLARIHLYRFRIIPDGNCLFRSVSQALFGTQELHMHVREETIAHLSEHVTDFLPFFEPPTPDEDLLDFAFTQIERLKELSFWGGFESLMALSDKYNIEFHVILGGVVKNSSVTIHKYYFCRDESIVGVGGTGEADEVAGAAAPRVVTPPKKIFLIWMSCGHYDLATDTPEEPLETEEWLATMSAIHASESACGFEDRPEEGEPTRKGSGRRKSSSTKKRTRSGQPAAADQPMPILTAALQQGPIPMEAEGFELRMDDFPAMEPQDKNENIGGTTQESDL